MSLGQALATSTAGLRATQAALALTASNVANADTPGYVRKTLTQVTSSAGASGVSVRVDAINRELDQYLQRQLRTEMSGGAYADLRAQFYSRLQSVYGAPGSASSLERVYNDFTTALQALAASPEDSAARSGALSAAQILAQQLNSMSNSVQGLRSDAELGLSNATQKANNAMKAIADINRQLATSVTQDATAATLEDQRDAYIDQLSKLMDIRVVETDHNQVNVFTNSGIQLVGRDAAQFSFQPQGTMTATAQWNADPTKSTVGSLVLVSPSGGTYDLIANNAVRSGQIAAYIEMRDQILVEAQTQLDTIASSMAQALSSTTVPGQPYNPMPQSGFDLDTSALLPGNTIRLTWTDTITGKQHNVSIVRVDDPNALPLKNDATADPNDEVIGVDFSGGMGSVITQLNAKFGGKVNFSNPSGNTLRILDDGSSNLADINAVSATVTQTGLAGGTLALPFFTDATSPYTGAITSLGSQSVGFAGRMVVNPALLADPSKLVVYQSGGYTADPARPNFIYDRLTTASLTFDPHSGIGSVESPFSGNLPSYLRQMVSMQGEAADNASSLAAGQDVVVNALQSRMAEGSSVNIDEEMANLLNLQTAYAANARIMSAVKDMLDTLMKM
jgi:flagellar hook-associated protein 1 FlgK